MRAEEKENSRQRRIREQRNTKEREFTRSELFGVFSKTSMWKQIGETFKISNHCPRLSIHKFCGDASFWYRASAGMSFKTKPDEDDGFGDPIPVCREYTLPRANPLSRAYAAILGEAIIGPKHPRT